MTSERLQVRKEFGDGRATAVGRSGAAGRQCWGNRGDEPGAHAPAWRAFTPRSPESDRSTIGGSVVANRTGLVLVVDDDVSVRESLAALLQATGFEVEVFESSQEFFARPLRNVPRCLVLDVQLPGLDGLEVQKRLAATDEALQIVFITGHGDIPMSVKAIKAGALEFLTKPFSDTALMAAIEQGLERSARAISGAAERRVLRARFESLTAREKDVLHLVNRGLLNKEIAGELGRAEITVKAHRGRMMRKMRADSVADLVRMIALLDLPEWTPARPGEADRERSAAAGGIAGSGPAAHHSR